MLYTQTLRKVKKSVRHWSDRLEHFVRPKEILSDQKLLNDLLNVVRTDTRLNIWLSAISVLQLGFEKGRVLA